MQKLKTLSVLSLILMLILSACGGNAANNAAPNAGAENNTANTGNDNAAEEEVVTEEPAMTYRMAAIYPGTITDADYNTLGHLGVTAVQDTLGVEIAYSETVAVPDVDRVMREYIDDGYNIVFTHGGQFFSQTLALALEFPDVYFIAEADAAAEDLPANLWVIVRNMEIGAYGAGSVSALISKTGTVGYIGGLTLPFSYAEVHAIEQAYADMGADIEFIPVWAGDFNDPTKARELSESLIASGADVIISSLNLGTLGVFEAAKNAEGEVRVIVKYTDKSEFAPDHYVTSMLYDFEGPLLDLVSYIMNGETSGNYHLGFDTGIGLQFPLMNVEEGITAEAEAIIASMIAGDIVVVKNTEPIE
ncbi:MAG: BMP family protein [Anaerolineae bacterium]|nr:BMP family protein [Anaerolineae bacterium]